MDVFRAICLTLVLVCILTAVWTLAFGGFAIGTITVIVAIMTTLFVFIIGSILWEHFF